MQKLKKYSGFTLIELLVVIAIIGILAAVVLVSLNSARTKSRDARRLADIHQVQTALELYYNDCGAYPTPASATTLSGGTQALYSGAITTTCANTAGFGTSAAGTTYLQVTPVAPTPADGSCTSAQNSYVYTTVSSGADYNVAFCMGGASGNIVAGVHTASSAGIK